MGSEMKNNKTGDENISSVNKTSTKSAEQHPPILLNICKRCPEANMNKKPNRQ